MKLKQMLQRSHLSAALKILAGAAILGLPSPLLAQSKGPVPRFRPGLAQGIVSPETSKELSGIAASRDNPGVLWVHGDSGNGSSLWAINTQGALLGTFALPNLQTIDCEGIAIGPGPTSGISYVYWGDIGDNAESRPHILVYRFAEPIVLPNRASKPVERTLDDVVSIRLSYPDGPHNAETLLLDPIEGDLLVGTKQKRVTRFYAAARDDLARSRDIKLTFVKAIDFDIASAGDISPDGAEILVRQEDFAWLFRRPPGRSIAAALSSKPQPVPLIGMPAEPNGEAIGFDGLGQGYFTVSEGTQQPLYYFRRLGRVAPTAPRYLIAAGSKWKYSHQPVDANAGWSDLDFNDSHWQTATAPIHPRDHKQGAILRHEFPMGKAKATDKVVMKLARSGSAKIFLNGGEVSLPPAEKLADSAGAPHKPPRSWHAIPLDSIQLRSGKNVVAIHLGADEKVDDKADAAFDLQLIAVPIPPTRK